MESGAQEMLVRVATAVMDNSTCTCSNSTTEVLEQQQALEMTTSLVLLLFALLGGNILHSIHLNWIPESCMFLFTGFMFAGVMRIFWTASELSSFMSLNGPIFMLVLLPPIIFDGGFSIKKVYFFRNIFLILQLAIVGTFVSAMFIGVVLWLLSTYTTILPVGMSAAECLAFGSLISATDPVAALAVYSTLGVEKTLFTLVYGESNLNDAIGIVLFTTYKEIADQGAGDASVGVMLLQGLLQFVLTTLVAPIFGILTGVASCLFFKFTKFNETPIMEAIAFWGFSYVSYLVADAFYLSGIISTLFCGFVMRHYTFLNLSERGKIISSDLIKSLATTFDCVIFLNLGIAILALPVIWNWWLVSISLALCFVGRAFVVLGIVNFGNFFRKKRAAAGHNVKPIGFKDQYILWHAGLRGAVAYVLTLELDTEFQEYWLATTLFIVIFTVMVLGITTAPVVKVLGVKTDKESSQPLTQINFTDFGEVYAGFEERFMTPFLLKRHCNEDLKDRQDMMRDQEPEEVEKELARQMAEEECSAHGHRRRAFPRTPGRKEKEYDTFGYTEDDLENPFHETDSINLS